MKRIRRAAADALMQSFRRLAQEHVIPRPPFRPWMRMARDYYGDAVEGSNGPLSDVLQAALPERFGEGVGLGAADHPWGYAAALVEAAVAAATRADEPYDVASPSVQATVDELIETIKRTPESRVVQVIADIDVDHVKVPDGRQDRLGETVEIAGVRIVRVSSEPERFIERELPSAGYEVERSDVFIHPQPAALLVATARAAPDFEARTTDARKRVERLLTALRLTTAATAYPVIDIAGDVGAVRCVRPVITRLPAWGYQFIHRSAIVRPSDLASLEAMVALLATLDSPDDWVAVRIGIGRLGRALDGRSTNIVDQVVDLAVGLEAILSGTDKTEVGLRLRSRAAALLAAPDDPSDVIYRDVKVLYELRSRFVHGAGSSADELTVEVGKVSSAARSSWDGERYLLVLDRWRDILRRAILARIALATAPRKAWSANGKRVLFDVDEVLHNTPGRDAWRAHIRSFWADRGLEAAVLPASPARFSIDEDAA